MDHPGKELLTGAALPEQEHGRGAHRDLLRLLLRFQQGTALADHLRVLCLRELFLEDQILGDELPGLQRLPDDYQEMVRVHRLLQEIERPFLDGLHGALDRPVCGHDDDGDHGILVLDGLQDFQARLPRQLEIRSEEHTSELQSLAYLVCRLLLEKKKKKITTSLAREVVPTLDFCRGFTV